MVLGFIIAGCRLMPIMTIKFLIFLFEDAL